MQNIEIFFLRKKPLLFEMGRIGHTQNVQLPDSLLETPGSLLNHTIIQSRGTAAHCLKSHGYRSGASVNVLIRHENGKNVISVTLTMSSLLVPDWLV